jgi:hypothetical protein
MLLTAALLALSLHVQDTTAFDGAVFAFQVPAGATVNENGNGAYFFTDVRRDARVEDQSDATLKLLVVPDGGGFDVASLTRGLIGDTGGRMTAAGLTAGANEVVERTFDGHTVAMTRIAYSDANAALWVFEFGAWQQGGAMVGVVTKCAAATLEAERAELDALALSLDAKEVTADSTRMLTAGFATVPIPLAAAVQVQAAQGETMHSIGTQQGNIYLHWGDAQRAALGAHELAWTWRTQHATEVQQMVQQAGAEYLGLETFLVPWGEGSAPGEAHRVRLADGGALEFRTTTFIQGGELLLLTAEVGGAQADVQRARIDTMQAALPAPSDDVGEHFVVVAGMRVDLPVPLAGDWQREQARTFVDYTVRTDTNSVRNGFAVEVCDAGTELAAPSAYAQAFAQRRSPAPANFVFEEGTLETAFGAVPTASASYQDGDQALRVSCAALPAGERTVLVAMVTRVEDERGHVDLWRRAVANAYVDAFDAAAADGRAHVQARRVGLHLPNPQWVAQYIHHPDYATLHASEPRAALDMWCAGEITSWNLDGTLIDLRLEIQEQLGTTLDAAVGLFGGTRRFGASHALVLGGQKSVDGAAAQLVRCYALRDLGGDVTFQVRAPLDAAERAATGVEALLDSLATTAEMSESPADFASFGTNWIVPEGFTIDETYSNGFAFLNIVSTAADSATLSARQFVDTLPDAEANEFAFQRENLTAVLEDEALTFETVDFELDVGGTRVPAVRFVIAATDTEPATHIVASARSFGPVTIGFTIAGTPEQLAETELCYQDLVARITAAPLTERFGGPDASFSHAVGTTVTPHASAGSGAVELLLTSPSGAELVLAHTNGAWTSRPAANELSSSEFAPTIASLATTDTQSAITWANALLTARFPSHGSVTDIANGVQWTAPPSTDPAAPTTPTYVRVRAWPDKTGGLDLYDTLIDFTDISRTDDATLEITRELRPLVGRTSFGRILHVRHADGRTEERHVHVLRCFDTDVAIDFTIDARDPAARADAELIASSLRLTTQPTAPGRLIQGNLVALVVPWHAAPFIDIYDATAEQIDVTLDADTTISLAIGPDTDEQRALHSLDLTFLFGADPTGGTPTTLPILGLDRPGELFTTVSGATDLALSRHRFTAPPHTLQFLAFYATTAAHTANDAQVRAIAATIQLR